MSYGGFMKFIVYTLILSLAFFFTACSSASVTFKANYGDLENPDVPNDLREIAKKSTSIIDYSSKIFDDNSFRSAEKADNSIKFTGFAYFLGVGYDKQEAPLDRAFKIYCEVKYPSRNIENSAHPKSEFKTFSFCAEGIKLDTGEGEVAFIEKQAESVRWYGPGNYRYNLIYTEDKNATAKAWVSDHILKAKGQPVDYDTSATLQRGVAVEYKLKLEFYSSGRVYLIRSVKNSSNAPFYYKQDSIETIGSGGVKYAVTFPVKENGEIQTDLSGCTQTKGNIVIVNPNTTCRISNEIEAKGFEYPASNISLELDGKVVQFNVHTVYSLNKEKYDSAAKKYGISVK
jgi:hypothetical protein